MRLKLVCLLLLALIVAPVSAEAEQSANGFFPTNFVRTGMFDRQPSHGLSKNLFERYAVPAVNRSRATEAKKVEISEPSPGISSEISTAERDYFQRLYYAEGNVTDSFDVSAQYRR